MQNELDRIAECFERLMVAAPPEQLGEESGTPYIADLILAIRALSAGDARAPGGLEALGIALAGDALSSPVGPALEDIAYAINNLAEAIKDSR